MATTIFPKPSAAYADDYILKTEKGSANGVAGLDAGGKVPSSQLPSYVDDVLEYDNLASFPASGESGKIYVSKDTNDSYRWSGSTYIKLSSYNTATQSASGLMSFDDKKKLDGISVGANKITKVSELTNDSGYLTSHQDISGKADKSSAISNITRSGTTFTATRADGTTFTFTQQDNNTTYSFSNDAPTLAWNTTSTVGTVGGVALTVKLPANPNTNTTYAQISRGSGAGLAPGLPSGSGTTKYLREDGTWQVPPDTNTNTTYSFTDKNPTLAWGTTSTVGVAGGVNFRVTMPANPNTDTNTTYSFTNKAPTLAWGTTSTVGVAGGVAFTVKMPANPDTNTTYSFTDKNPTLAWGTTSTVGVAGSTKFRVTMPANPVTRLLVGTNVAVGATKTVALPSGTTWLSVIVVDSFLLVGSTIYNQAAQVQTVTTSGIAVKNTGGAAGDIYVDYMIV